MIIDNYFPNKGEHMKQNKNISIKQIAQLSGVSVATVSRVINNNGRFSEETVIISKLSYKVNNHRVCLKRY